MGSINLLDIGTNGFYLLDKTMSIETARHCAHALLGAIAADKILVKTHKGYLSADGMFITMGASGITKSIPINEANRIARELKIVIPSVFTTESLREYFSKKENGAYVYPNNGIIFWDEMSQQFSEAKNKKYMTGTIETMSSLYNHHLKSLFLKREDMVKEPQKPYVSMLGAMVTYYIKKIPEHVFVQGLAGRINWNYVRPEDSEYTDSDWNDSSGYDKAQEHLKKFKDGLELLMKNMPNSHVIVTLDDDANLIIKKTDKKIHDRWRSDAINNPFGWDWTYLKRLPEMTVKSALRYAIGRVIMENGKNVSDLKQINMEDMNHGIAQINVNIHSLNGLFMLRKNESVQISPLNKVGRTLMIAKPQLLTISHWRRNRGW